MNINDRNSKRWIQLTWSEQLFSAFSVVSGGTEILPFLIRFVKTPTCSLSSIFRCWKSSINGFTSRPSISFSVGWHFSASILCCARRLFRALLTSLPRIRRHNACSNITSPSSSFSSLFFFESKSLSSILLLLFVLELSAWRFFFLDSFWRLGTPAVPNKARSSATDGNLWPVLSCAVAEPVLGENVSSFLSSWNLI